MKGLPNALVLAGCMLLLLVCLFTANGSSAIYDPTIVQRLQHENDSLRQVNIRLDAQLHTLDSLATNQRQQVNATAQTIHQLKHHAHASVDSIIHFSAGQLFGFFAALNPDTSTAQPGHGTLLDDSTITIPGPAH